MLFAIAAKQIVEVDAFGGIRNVVPDVHHTYSDALGWGAKFGPEGSSIIGSPSGNPE